MASNVNLGPAGSITLDALGPIELNNTATTGSDFTFTGGKINIAQNATAIDTAGTVTFGSAQEASIFHEGTISSLVLATASSTNILLDSDSDITLDAAGGDIFFKDGTATQGSINMSGTDTTLTLGDSTSSTGLLVLNSRGGNSVTLTVPATGVTSYTVQLPTDITGAGPGDVLEVSTVTGGSVLTTQWAPPSGGGATTLGDLTDVLLDSTKVLLINTDGSAPSITAIGTNALNNIGIGASVFTGLTNGVNNNVIGNSAGDSISTGNDNNIYGFGAGGALTDGAGNVFIGSGAGSGTSSLSESVIIGQGAGTALMTIDANGTVSIGYESGKNLTSGEGNTFVGKSSGNKIVDGEFNTVVGYEALDVEVSGNNSTAIGYRALTEQIANPTGAVDNTALGFQAGSVLTDGIQNTFLGSGAGSTGANAIVTGDNNTIIGYQAAASSSSATNEITLGNGSVQALRCGITAITTLSDARDKTNVIDSPYGLDFVDSLRPVQFTWQRRVLEPADENHSKNGTTRVGFLAQDFLASMPDNENEILDLVYETNPERIEAKYGNLVPILTQAIKDLKAQNDALSARLTALESA
tara:strand:+ start:20632 stop:22383 length:1752 start_codon:yes stop_codon:yes gene_type:complete